MVTQKERQNFQWRPNDNSTTTNLRYDLEASHWLESFKINSKKSSNAFIEAPLYIGFFLGIIINLLSLIFIGIAECIQWMRGKKRPYKPQSFKEKYPHLVNTPLTVEEKEGIRKTWKYNLENDGFKSIEEY